MGAVAVGRRAALPQGRARPPAHWFGAYVARLVSPAVVCAGRRGVGGCPLRQPGVATLCSGERGCVASASVRNSGAATCYDGRR